MTDEQDLVRETRLELADAEEALEGYFRREDTHAKRFALIQAEHALRNALEGIHQLRRQLES